MATSKITKFDPKPPFQGTTSAFVTFEDDNWGFFEYKGDAQFKEGDEVEYNATEEKTKGGKKIFKLTMGKTSQVNAPRGENKPPLDIKTDTKTDIPPKEKLSLTKEELVDIKVQLRKEVIRVIGEVAAAGRIEPKEMAEYYNEFYLATDASIDELCK